MSMVSQNLAPAVSGTTVRRSGADVTECATLGLLIAKTRGSPHVLRDSNYCKTGVPMMITLSSTGQLDEKTRAVGCNPHNDSGNGHLETGCPPCSQSDQALHC